MTNRIFRFGILGCGMIANVHARAVAAIAEAMLVGVADNNPEAARRFAEKHGARAYASYGEMLADPAIDVVCICTPSGFHADNAIEALKHGKHVVLEKPMALTSEDAARVADACRASGKLLTVISQLRFSEDLMRVKRLIADGAFGKLTLCSLYMKYYRTPEYYSSGSWKGTLAFDGGGALMNQGIHGIDLLLYMIGDVRTVNGRIKTLVHGIETEDTAAALLEFENGALGVIEGSTCAYPGFERRIEIHGDRGYARIRENRIEALMCNGERIEVEDPGEALQGFNTASDPTALGSEDHQKQIENLLAAIKGEAPLLVDVTEGGKAVRLIERIYESSKEDGAKKPISV